MKTLLVSIATGALMAAGAAVAGDPAVELPIHQMMEGFNKGDIALAKSAHVAAPSITDETHPFLWSGPGAFDAWLAQLTKNEAEEGKTGGLVWFGDPIRESVAGDQAYVFTPCTYTFKQQGHTMRETGDITFVLAKQADGWKIASWTWTSPEAAPVK